MQDNPLNLMEPGSDMDGGSYSAGFKPEKAKGSTAMWMWAYHWITLGHASEMGLPAKAYLNNRLKFLINILVHPDAVPELVAGYTIPTRNGEDKMLRSVKDFVDKGEIKFIPDNYEKIFRYWMTNTIDWNISRQIVWGIPIPAWFRDGEAIASKEKPEGEGWVQDTDTFDTWFSSGQWPLMVTGFPESPDFNKYYPTDVMETGHDLIFKWVPRMVIFGLYLGNKAPFHTVYLHGLVNDAQGKKMSKSKGNVINPLTLTDKYGTDALRMALIVGNTPGTDVALQEDKVKAYKNFANKIWNITRFVLTSTENFDGKKPELLIEQDLAYISELDEITKDVSKDMDEYRFYLAAEKLYHYVWHSFADKIIEESKEKLKSEDTAVVKSTQYTLLHLLRTSLKLLHPFMPFVTEEIWSHIKDPSENLLIVTKWPK
jgi:valyl-tRNA synthetase